MEIYRNITALSMEYGSLGNPRIFHVCICVLFANTFSIANSLENKNNEKDDKSLIFILRFRHIWISELLLITTQSK